MAKVIKLTDNNNATLLPITNASYVQISYNGVVKSVTDAIIENEEVTAAALNDLNVRLSSVETTVENSSPTTIVATYNNTGGKLFSYTTDGVTKTAYLPIATTTVLGGIKSATTDTINSNSIMGVNVDSVTGIATVAHYNIDSSALTPVSATSTDSGQLTHDSSFVVTGLSYQYDPKGHLKNITLTRSKLPKGLDVTDDRNINDAPYAYAKSITAHFKANNTNNLAKGFSTILEINGWSDTSGGPAHELAFTQTGGEIWHRTSSSASAWNTWSQLLETSNVNLTSSASGASNTVTLSYGGLTKDVTLTHYNPISSPQGTTKVIGPPAGSPTTKTLAHSGTFAVPRITYDANGHISIGETITYTLPASDNTDTKTGWTSTTTDAGYPIVFHYYPTTQTTTTAQTVRFDSERTAAYYNPGRNTLYVTHTYASDFMHNGQEVLRYSIVNSNMTTLSLF